LVLFWWF